MGEMGWTAARDPSFSLNVVIITAVMGRKLAPSARPRLGRTPRVLTARPVVRTSQFATSDPTPSDDP